MTVAQSSIKRVKLHQRGATVYREVVIQVEPGGKIPDEIEIPNLPLALLDVTVRLRVDSTDNPEADLVAADMRVGLYVPPRDKVPEQPDEKELRKVDEEIQLRRTALSHLRMEVELLGRIEVPERPEGEEGKAPPSSPMAARFALEEFVDGAVEVRIQQSRKIREEVEKLYEKRRELEEKLRLSSTALRASVQELTKTVVARLRSVGVIRRATLTLEYFVAGARWAPAYQVRLSRDCQSAQLQMRALVCQRTGEDWKGAELLLSTAAPMSWTELPELTSIRLGRAQAPLSGRPGFRPPPVGSEGLFHDFDRSLSRTQDLIDPPHSFALAEPVIEPLGVSLSPDLDGSAISEPRMMEKVDRAVLADEDGEAWDDKSITGVFGGEAMEMIEEEIEVASVRDEAAPPPPPPAPRRAPMARAASASRPAPAKSSKKRRSRDTQELRGLPEDAVISQRLELLVYTQLRLAPPDDSGRNRLRPLDQRDTYLEILSRQGVGLEGDAMEAVAFAMDRSSSVLNAQLPPGAIDVAKASRYFDFAYPADEKVDVPSDGSFHSVALGSREAQCDVRYVTVPREDPQVYRIAMIQNPSRAPLLGGAAEIYVGGEYVLTTQLPTVVSRGKAQLGLGVEQAIKCARNTHYSEARSGDQIVATSELRHSIEIELVNNLGRPVQCEVRERIPQPDSGAEIVIEEGPIEPKWKPYLQEDRSAIIRGGRRWEVVVPERAKKKLSAEYVVKIYANNELAGGNRREA